MICRVRKHRMQFVYAFTQKLQLPDTDDVSKTRCVDES